MGGVALDATARPGEHPTVEPAPGPAADPQEPPRPTLGYRPALDGLRAVAVLAVMVEHSGVRRPGSTELLLPGGFLGVDVFFVISGFLITSLLLIEHQGRGGIDLRQFWLRRARRLLPAAALAIAVTCVVAAIIDLDIDGTSLRGDALAALGYVANWRFIVTDQSYFAAFGVPSPFRHLWSLSLEEQWYLVFPPLLVGLLALVRHRTGALLGVLGTAAAASTVWMAVCYTPGKDPSRAYYGTDTRAQTLLVGALLAVAMVRLPELTRRLGRLTPVLGIAGLGALAAMFLAVSGTNEALYRGGFLVVALASLAAVAAVALPGASGPAHWALGQRPFVAVGVMSYGLYLWHWPVFVMMTPDRVGLTGVELAAARMAVAFVVAIASYVLVEQPIRRHGLAGVVSRLRRIGLRVRPAAVTVALVVVVVVAVGASTRTMPTDPAAEWTPVTVPDNADAVTTTSVPVGYMLPAVPADQPVRLMVGGDSVAWSMAFPWLVREQPTPASVEDLRLVATLGCTITPGIPVVDGVEWPPTMCPDWPATWEATAFEFQPDVMVVMWGAWEVYDHRQPDDEMLVAGTPAFGVAYEAELAESIDLVASVSPNTRIVFATVPCMAEDSLSLGGPDSPRNDPANLAWVNERTERVAAAHPGRTMVVDLGPLVCSDGEPLTEYAGMAPRYDGVHFAPEFGEVVWDYIEQQVRPWLAAPTPVPTA